MNMATRPSLFNPQGNPFNLRAALFHSTPVLDRRRRTHWDSGGGAYRGSSKRFNPYAKRYRKLHAKETLLHNVSAFAEHLFQSWQNGSDEFDPSSSKESSWFRREYGAKGSKEDWTGTKGPHISGRRAFHFYEDDGDVETIFRSAFGGNRYFYWSFVDKEFPRSSSGYSNNYRISWTSRLWDEEEYYDSSTESDSLELDLASDRLALGLSSSGPLKMEDVKHAYRACALKWHPDRHHGPSKAVAEEKFKACSAAYQSLCDKLAPS